MGRVFLFSLTSMLNPTLLAATTLMLLLDRPRQLMLGYLLGALTTSVTLGLVIVFTLSGSGAAKTTQHSLSPAADLALGAIALVAASILRSGRAPPRRRRESRSDKKPPRWQRELSKGSARTTFLVGVLFTLPGASYLAGLHKLSTLHYTTAVTVLVVIGFNLIMLLLLEVPLVSFVVAPDWTPDAIRRARAWVSVRWRRVATYGFAAIGILLVIKGVVGLVE
jgi:hypothetical protein